MTKSLLADVVADLSRDGGDVTEEALQLLDAFSTPRLSYDSMRKQFTLLTDRVEKRSLHGEAIHKVRTLTMFPFFGISTLAYEHVLCWCAGVLVRCCAVASHFMLCATIQIGRMQCNAMQ